MAAKRNGHTLVELMVIVVILGAIAFIAIPRLSHSGLYRKQAGTTAKRIITDLRRTRRLAISDAATNTDGYALNRTGSSFEIEDLSDSTTVLNSTFTISANVTCSGGTSFQFGPLGNLKAGSDSQLTVSSSGKSYTIDVIAATGIIKCTEN